MWKVGQKYSSFFQMSASLKFDFQKRKQLRFSEVHYLNYTKKTQFCMWQLYSFPKTWGNKNKQCTHSTPVKHGDLHALPCPGIIGKLAKGYFLLTLTSFRKCHAYDHTCHDKSFLDGTAFTLAYWVVRKDWLISSVTTLKANKVCTRFAFVFD